MGRAGLPYGSPYFLFQEIITVLAREVCFSQRMGRVVICLDPAPEAAMTYVVHIYTKNREWESKPCGRVEAEGIFSANVRYYRGY